MSMIQGELKLWVLFQTHRNGVREMCSIQLLAGSCTSTVSIVQNNFISCSVKAWFSVEVCSVFLVLVYAVWMLLCVYLCVYMCSLHFYFQLSWWGFIKSWHILKLGAIKKPLMERQCETQRREKKTQKEVNHSGGFVDALMTTERSYVINPLTSLTILVGNIIACMRACIPMQRHTWMEWGIRGWCKKVIRVPRLALLALNYKWSRGESLLTEESGFIAPTEQSHTSHREKISVMTLLPRFYFISYSTLQ